MSRDLSRWRRMLAVNLWCVMVLATSVFAAESSSQAPAVKQIKLATLEWPPYVGKKLKQQGYVHEVVVTALERVGYEVQIQYVPWPRALREVSLGEVDAIFPTYYTPERSRQLAFSEPFAGGPVGLYKRRDTPATYPVDPRSNPVAALRGVREYSVGVVRGYANPLALENVDFLTQEAAKNDLVNLRRLYHKRVDLIVIDKFVADYLLETSLKEYRPELEFMQPPLEIKYFYLAFSLKDPNHQAKLKAFNRGLALIREDGTLDRIYERHGMRSVLHYEHELSSTGLQEKAEPASPTTAP